MAIIELSLKEFDEYAIKHPYKSFYQTSQYGTLMSRQGYSPLYIGLDEGGVLRGAALILTKSQLFGFKHAYSPRGFLIDFNDYQLVADFTYALKDYLNKKAITYLTIDPHITHLERDNDGKPIETKQTGVNISESLKRIGYEHRGFNLYFENAKPRWNMVLKTDRQVVEVFNSFEKQTRTKIRNSLRKGVEIYKGNKDDIKLFYKMINKKHYRKFKYYLDMYDIFSRFNMFDVYFARINTETFLRNSKLLYEHEMQVNSKLSEMMQKHIRNEKEKIKLTNRKMESDKLLNSYKADVIFGNKIFRESKYIVIATNAVIKYGQEVFFLIDGINYKFDTFNANHLIKWKVIEECRNQGFTKFHLNGITGDFTRRNKYLGLYTFKRGFNANVTEYIGEYKLIINKAKYGLYTSLKPIIDLFEDDKKN